MHVTFWEVVARKTGTRSIRSTSRKKVKEGCVSRVCDWEHTVFRVANPQIIANFSSVPKTHKLVPKRELQKVLSAADLSPAFALTRGKDPGRVRTISSSGGRDGMNRVLFERDYWWGSMMVSFAKHQVEVARMKITMLKLHGSWN